MADDVASLYAQHLKGLRTRVLQLLEKSEFDALIIHSGSPTAKSSRDDQYWPHRITPSFAHWLPGGRADSALVVGDSLRLFEPQGDDFWHSAPTPHLAEVEEHIEIRALPASLSELRPRGRCAFVGDRTDAGASMGIGPEDINPPDLVEGLEALRIHKSEYEIACIAEANRLAAVGHLAVASSFQDEVQSELDLHLTYLRATGQDAVDTPYANIVALGSNAAVLHHAHYERERNPSSGSLLIDAGAQFRGYASDITRTYAKGQSSGAERFAQTVALLDHMQQKLVAEARPGLSFEELHNRCHQLLAPVLREIGVTSASDEALIEGGVTRAFLPHGLGHSLGLQVHDVGLRTRVPEERNPYLRNTSTIEPEQVLTIEPGLYFIPAFLKPLKKGPCSAQLNWRTIEELTPFGGVRIEDNIAVGTGNNRNLTRDNWPKAP